MDYKFLVFILSKLLVFVLKCLQRFFFCLQQYDVEIRYRFGREMYFVDILLRVYLSLSFIDIQRLEIEKEVESIYVVDYLVIFEQKLSEIK